MQRLLLGLMFLFFITICNAQDHVEIDRKIKNYYKHKDFYLSLCGGVNSGSLGYTVSICASHLGGFAPPFTV